jgi:hypothetical protein
VIADYHTLRRELKFALVAVVLPFSKIIIFEAALHILYLPHNYISVEGAGSLNIKTSRSSLIYGNPRKKRE